MDISQTKLYAIASAASLQPRAVHDPTGGLLLTVHGARVLGVFLDGVAENLLWINNAALDDAEHARQFVAAGEWNLGGDRGWLAPELELYFRHPAQPSHADWGVPAAIDPGRYAVQREGPTGVALETAGDMVNPRTQSPFRFQIARTICLCPPPINAAELSYVGYELSSELRVLAPDRPDACYGLWQIMQLPPGGTVFVPVRRPPELVDYFRTGVASYCRTARGHVAFPVTGEAKHKLGLRAADVYGTMGYFRPESGGRATLIVRHAAVFPGATYADYPAHQPQRRDVALQFYNDSGGFGGFGEMEVHAPAAIAGRFFQALDVCYTWCFGGARGRVQEIARQLLGELEIG
jgi:hypothetical protein